MMSVTPSSSVLPPAFLHFRVSTPHLPTLLTTCPVLSVSVILLSPCGSVQSGGIRYMDSVVETTVYTEDVFIMAPTMLDPINNSSPFHLSLIHI